VNQLLSIFGFGQNTILTDKISFAGLIFVSNIWREAGWSGHYLFGSNRRLPEDKVESINKLKRQESKVADWFKAFSDVTRVKLISLLLNKELCVNDLSTLMDMNQSAVSHQLRFLRNLRIVKRRKQERANQASVFLAWWWGTFLSSSNSTPRDDRLTNILFPD
jgi:Predicted transcriptional regulators